jgi:hypothetical protein
MIVIKEIVQQALINGFLSVKAQQQINSLLKTSYDSEDIDALIVLQRSIRSGKVKQESDIGKKYRYRHQYQDSSPNIKLAYQVAAEIACVAAMALSITHTPQDQSSLGT